MSSKKQYGNRGGFELLSRNRGSYIFDIWYAQANIYFMLTLDLNLASVGDGWGRSWGAPIENNEA